MTQGALTVPRGKTTRGVVAENTQMRVLALLNQSLDELNERKAKGHKDQDFVAKLADQMLEDPKAAMAAMLEWLGKVAPADAAATAPGLAFDIKALYLNATQTVNGHEPRGPVLEHEPVEGTIGVQDGATDW